MGKLARLLMTSLAAVTGKMTSYLISSERIEEQSMTDARNRQRDSCKAGNTPVVVQTSESEV
jgi:hypothetical protein